MQQILKTIDSIVWGPPLIILVLLTGILLTVRMGGIQFTKIGYIFRNTLFKMFHKGHSDDGDVTPFQAVSAALAATVGTGNIVGVATAILTGGPGAVFWMWLAAIFGMATKYAEVTLAVAYRQKKANGEYVGGPMYYIDKGLGLPWLGKLFALFAGIATFGIGNTTQANSIAGILKGNFGIPPIAVGIVLALMTAMVIVGGIRSITKVTEKLVPFMSAFYILGGLVVLIINFKHVPGAFLSIFEHAFSGKAAVGGAVGYGVMHVIKAGISRGIFTNEAGLGSSPIAQASAATDHPARQGMWGVFEVLVDTIFVCTINALVILSSGALAYETDATVLTSAAFSTGFGFGRYIVTIGLVLFAFSTILGWEYYGETSIHYIFGEKSRMPYRILYVIAVVLGSIADLGMAWDIANILNGLMALPNLIGVIGLSKVVVDLTKDFFADPDRVRTSTEEINKMIPVRRKNPTEIE